MINMEEIIGLFTRLSPADQQKALDYLAALVQAETEDKNATSPDSQE